MSKNKSDEVAEGSTVDVDLSAADNDELPPADAFVGSEKSIPAERNQPVLSNLTPHGMPADAHQVLVGLAQVTDVHKATVHEEIKAVLAKYEGHVGLSEEVRSHLQAALKELAPAARLHLKTKELLEKHV